MIFVEFFSDSGDLSEFELGEAQAAPSFGGSDERAEHELEHRLLAEAIGNDFQPPSFLDEQPFEEVRRPCETTMRDRQAQVRDAGLEIVLETGERTGQDVGVIGADAGRQLARDRPRWRLMACGGPRLEFGPRIGRDLRLRGCASDAPDSAGAPSGGSLPRSPG